MKIINFGFKILILGLLMSTIVSCASIVDGTTQKITVVTPPTTGAKCSLSNDKGKWYINNTPGFVMVHKSGDFLAVSCQRKGYRTGEVDVTPKTKAMIYGNLVFGGFIGIGIDDFDGAAYYYPDLIKVPMQLIYTN